MRLRLLAAMLVAHLLIGSVFVPSVLSQVDASPVDVEVRLGRLASGSTVASDGTNATASVVGSVGLLTTHVLYLNNTNATGTWYAKLSLAGNGSLGNLRLARIGINNGVATDQIVVFNGAVTQTAGAYVALAPGSVNRVFVSDRVVSLGVGTSFDVTVSLTQETNETTLVRYPMTLSLT